jgi:hypothetical protein
VLEHRDRYTETLAVAVLDTLAPREREHDYDRQGGAGTGQQGEPLLHRGFLS